MGTGTDVSILEVAQMIAKVVDFAGRIDTDPSKPDGTMRKLMDVSRLSDMGWDAKVALEHGLEETYAWYLENYESARG